jgi:hypothetical protein
MNAVYDKPGSDIELNETHTVENAAAISKDTGRVAVLVIRTDEELMIARSVCRALELGLASEKGIPTMRRNTPLGWINSRRALPLRPGRVTPHSKQPAPSLVM